MSQVARRFELPPGKAEANRRAVRLEWLTIAYLVSAVFVVYLVLGSSQAMKAAWIEDLLSFLPPLAFLLASRVRRNEPNEKFPWGYHGAVSVAYLAAALALLVMGSYIFVDSAIKLATAEHPSIGGVEIFGETIWSGWLMLPALAYTGIPAVLLGRRKLPYAAELHDKVLHADAEMNKADWMTAAAAAAGIIGIGVGLWWADAVAALVISLDIIHDGANNIRTAVGDVMDERATRHDSREPHPLIKRLRDELEDLDWVRKARVRVREQGHVFEVEAFVVPTADGWGLDELDEARERLLALDWKIHDVVLSPVSELPEREEAGGQ